MRQSRACRVRDPDRKGKVESGIGHTQKAVRGLRFQTLELAQAWLDHWDARWADTRVHGTTKRQVGAAFAEERLDLRPRPVGPFRYYAFAERTVHLDGFVEVGAAYYAPPPGWIGRVVYVQWDEHHVRLLDPKTGVLLREHLVTDRGRHRIQPEDRPSRTPPGVTAHTTRDGASPRMITTPIYSVEHPLDLALVPVDATDLDPLPIGVEGLATTSELADRDILFIQGFPGVRSRSLTGAYSDTLPYVTAPGASSFAWFDPKLHFAIDYAASGLIDERGNAADMVDPHGLSGSAVWATGRCTMGDSWGAVPRAHRWGHSHLG